MIMSSSYNLAALLPLYTLHILLVTADVLVPNSSKLALRLIHGDSIPWRSHSSDDDIRAPVMSSVDGSLFLVNVSIGEPPVPLLLAMDTGSRLTWAHCTHSVFDRDKSSTYRALSTRSRECAALDYRSEGAGNSECYYKVRYEDGSMSSGVVALEKLTLTTATGGTVQVANATFGCALATAGRLPPGTNGILGLEAPDEYYLVAQTGNKFSYCIGNISDTGYMYNHLILGHGAILQGDSTPMRIKDGHYTVSIQGISVGDKKLAVDHGELYYNVEIDSGSTFTMLRRSAYDPLLQEVNTLIGGLLTPITVKNAQNCYKGSLARDLKGFPVVTFHLAGGVDLVLDVEAMFKSTNDGSAFCMAVAPSDKNLIGVLAQQNYNVGFDLDAMRVSFQRIECELLED